MAKVYRDRRPRKHGGIPPWCLSFLGLDGRRHRERTDATTKEEALALLRMKQSEITKARLMGVQTMEAIKPRTFEQFVKEEYLLHCRATHAIESYRGNESSSRMVGPFFGKMNLRAITAGDVQRFVDQTVNRKRPVKVEKIVNGKKKLEKEWVPIKPATVNRRLMFVSGVLSEAVRRGYIDRNPARGVSQLPEHNDRLRWLNPQEEERILSFAPDYLRPIILTALHTGMRLGEVMGLKWADVDSDQRLIRVSMTKNHKTRYIPVNSALVEVLKAIPPHITPPCPFVFVNPLTGTRYEDVGHAFGRACRSAGLEDVTFHTMRHTFASRLAQEGIPLNTIRELLGHGSMQMTLRYAHLAPSDLREAVEVLAGGRKKDDDGTSTAQNHAQKVALP